jgi:Trk K+ transport system NAD-binding subunit
VVIERSADNPFIPTARRLGAAVIVGNAAVPEVLRQAHAATARSVLAVTSNELANVEVALLTRELNPKQRVVLRLTDPNLAVTLRDAAEVRLAVSLPALAAPAFVAALFGDRVRSVFLVEGRLLAAVDLVVAAGDGLFEGRAVRALAVDFRFLPVALLAAGGGARSRPLNARLAAGDRLTVIIGLTDLQRLLQREAAPAEWAVDVTACPLPTRPWLATLLQTEKGLDAEAARQASERLPVCLRDGLTRGQAEDLLYLLVRERVTGELRRTAP